MPSTTTIMPATMNMPVSLSSVAPRNGSRAMGAPFTPGLMTLPCTKDQSAVYTQYTLAKNDSDSRA